MCLSLMIKSRRLWKKQTWMSLSMLFLGVVICIFAGSLITGKVQNIETTLVSHEFISRKECYENVATSIPNQTPQQCRILHVAVFCIGSMQVRETVFMLRTLLYHVTNHVMLHVITNKEGQVIIQTLFNTWQGKVPLSFNFVERNNSISEKDDARLFFQLHKILPPQVSQVIFVDYRVRFTSDISLLWETFNSFSPNQLFGLTSDDSSTTNKVYYVDLMLFDLKKIRERGDSGFDVLYTWKYYSDLFHKLDSHRDWFVVLPCIWLVRLKKGFNFETCLHDKEPHGLWWSDMWFTNHTLVEKHKENVINILTTAVEAFTYHSRSKDSQISHCLPIGSWNANNTQGHVTTQDECVEFRTAAALQKRTHLYYIKSEGSQQPMLPVDVTLVTQLTITRLEVLGRMLENWKGPAVIVLHVTDQDAFTLPQKITNLPTMKQRQDVVVVHVVYTRKILGPLNPINYLRNIGLKSVKTSFSFYVDVDLLPSPNMYPTLSDLLKSANSTQVAWVVPAFQLFDKETPFPQTKSDLVQLLKEDKASGYGMKNKWNLGHKATDFTKWETAAENYVVPASGAFEPYIVLKTDGMPLYDERLLERMADKIIYTKHLVNMGYKFTVLSDVFVLHVPHPPSPVTHIYSTYPNMFKCGSKLSKEVGAELKEKYNSS